MELIISIEMLESFLEETLNGEYQHKGMFHLFKDILMLGYLNQESHKITLTKEGLEAELDEDVQQYIEEAVKRWK